MKPIGVVQSAPAVRGLLDGGTVLWVPATKDPSCTRIFWVENETTFPNGKYTGWVKDCGAPFLIPIKPPVQSGDVVWIKETWCEIPWEDGMGKRSTRVLYRAIEPELFDRTVGDKWRSPVTMPHWASRFERIVTAIGMERRDGMWQWRIETEITP